MFFANFRFAPLTLATCIFTVQLNVAEFVFRKFQPMISLQKVTALALSARGATVKEVLKIVKIQSTKIHQSYIERPQTRADEAIFFQ